MAKQSKKTTFVVTPRVQEVGSEVKPRLIKASRISRVVTHIIQDFNIVPASEEDIHNAGKNGIEIEAASESNPD